MSNKQRRRTAIALAILLSVTVGGLFLVHRLEKANRRPAFDDDGNCISHADVNNDGFCDHCAVSVLVEIDFFAVNDLHGKLQDTGSQPGVDELTTYLETMGTNTVLLSSGDMWQGSSESNLTGGEIIIEWMNKLGFVSMTVGNHEFDWGLSLPEENAPLAAFPFLGINVFSTETNERVSFCQPSVMVERDGVKIGIIGAIGDCYSSIAPERAKGFYFVTGTQLTKLVREESERLRALGADLIVYSIHDGYSGRTSGLTPVTRSQLSGYYDTSLSGKYVDLVFEAHVHQKYVLRDFNGVYHLQGGGENSGISHAEVMYNTANDSFKVTEAEVVDSSVYRQASPSPLRDELLEKYADRIARGNEVLGISRRPYEADDLRQLVARLYYEKGQEMWGDRYDIVLGGGYLNVRSPYRLAGGTVTYSNLQELFPFDNRLVLCSVSGRHLLSQFILSENRNYCVYLGDYGTSVRNSIDPDGTYYIVIDRYSSAYAPNHCTEVEEYTDGVYSRDLLAEYFASVLEPAGTDPADPHGGYEITPIPEILRIGAALDPNGRTASPYYVRGTVVSVEDTKYGNLTIADENGNTLYVYGVNDVVNNVRYDMMKDPPTAGDTVVLSGVVQRYVSSGGTEIIEIYKALLIGRE